MKAAIYSPYLDIFGGGERYMMTIAETLSLNKIEVDVILDKHLETLGSLYLKNQFTKIFDFDLSKTNFVSGPMGKGSNFLARTIFLKNYDLLFYLTDGSIFYPTAKKNILHIQSPLVGQPAKSLWGKIKLKGWNLIIYNSEFTKKHSLNNWPQFSQIIYPPVDTDQIKPLSKKKYILSVGRFFGYLKDKKHAILIKAFKELYKHKELNGWSLHLAGVASDGDKVYLKELRELAIDLPIYFYPNIKYNELIKLYGYSSIYWHAAGFDETDPTKMEHFGISTVEAMAAGCVPVVINKGGQTEIVDNDETGFLWDTLNDLKDLSLKIVLDEKLRLRMSKASMKRAKIFSKNIFTREIIKLINI